MSFWTNPVKAVRSWLRPVDAFLKAVLPTPLYNFLITALSKEGRLVGQLTLAALPLLLSGQKTVPQLAAEIKAQGLALAEGEIMNLIRAYATPDRGV